jgi:two-component system, NtrC family, sensor kinase
LVRIFSLGILFIIILGNRSFAQNPKVIDSLKQALNNHRTEDAGKVEILYDLAWSLNDVNNDAAMLFAREGMQLSRKLNQPKNTAIGNLVLANIYATTNKHDSAVFVALEGLETSERLHLDTLSIQLYFSLGGHYRLLGNYELAEYYDKKCLDAAASFKNEWFELLALQELMALYREKGERDKVKNIVNRALPLATKLNNEFAIARILWEKARDYAIQRNFQEAINSHHEALAIWRKQSDYHGLAFSMTLLSATFLQMNNKDSAGWYAQAALDTALKYHLAKETFDAYGTLFNFHNQYKNYKKALEERLILDSIENELNSNSGQTTVRAEMKYEQEKKNLLASIAQERQEAAARRERILAYTIIAGFILLAAFLLYNNRQNQRAKIRIEKAYAELKTTQAKLIQSEKMASLGELTAGIAHEIQNPLNFVNNFSQVNKELIDEATKAINTGNLNEAVELLSTINNNEDKIIHHGQRADSIVKGMLLHSRETKGEKEPADLNALAEEYLRLSYQGLRARDKSFNASLKTHFDPTIGKISIVSQDIGRVFLNLYNNAFYAVNEKKKEIPEAYEPTVSIITERVNGRVEIRVKDNGKGIPEKIKEKIFQPFFTTKPAGQGTGLGLSLSYDIVKAHGGEISVDNKDGEFTEFVIQLPV